MSTDDDITKLIKRLTLKDMDSIPDKCDTCAFKIEYDGRDQQISKIFIELSTLRDYGFSDYLNRTMTPGKDSFCALGNNKYWGTDNKNKKCPDRQIEIPGTRMNLSDYLSIHHTKVNTRISNRITIVAIIASIILGIVIKIF